MIVTPSQRKLLAQNGEKTFDHDRHLPKLPLPNLEATINKYIESLTPFLSLAELDKTKGICQHFLTNEGPILQSLLEKRYETKENWLADWWLKYGYLTYRGPLMPFLNTAGINSLQNPGYSFWPVPCSPDQGLQYLSHSIFFTFTFIEVVQNESLAPDKSRNGTRFNMEQLKLYLGTTRIPGKEEDILQSYLKTKSEGVSSRHAVVLRKGHVFVLEPFHPDGSLYSISDIHSALRMIKSRADGMERGLGIGALNADYRENWWKNRNQLLSHVPGNKEALDKIESALMVYVLDEACPTDTSDSCRLACMGDVSNRWADKSYSLIVFDNGYIAMNCDHSPCEAMTSVVLDVWATAGIFDVSSGYQLPQSSGRTVPMPELIRISVPDTLRQAIAEVKIMTDQLRDDFLLQRFAFEDFGHNFIKEKLKTSSDAFVQCCIQLAYFRLHGKPAPTYETATTRKYRLARTETVRSCSQEMVDFVKGFLAHPNSPSIQSHLFKRASDKHLKLMKEASDGFGCDRHLFGLYLVASENGFETPTLFKDPAFVKSGGNGNFILSTSTSGYTGLSGGTAAMCKDGYGCFYNFDCQLGLDRIWFWTTNYRSSSETSLEKFRACLELSLREVSGCIIQSSKL